MRTALPLVLVAASVSLPAQQIVAGPTLGPLAYEAGDVDGDGYSDYTVQISPATTTEVHSGRTRTALPHLTFSSFSSYSPLFGDVDGDGCDDLALGGNQVVSGRTGATWLALPPGQRVWCAGDLDADGFDDLFVWAWRSGSSGDGDLALRSSRTGAVLLTRFVPFQMFTSMTWARANDVNGDGYDDFLDLIIDNFYFNHSSSVIGGPTLVALGISLTGSLLQRAGDTNGDGIWDLGRNDDILDGTTLAPIWAMPPGVRALRTPHVGESFDIDGDGFDDAYGDAQGAWSGRTHAALPGAPAGLAPLGDIDGDGRTEFAASGVLYEWQDPAMPRCSRAVRRGAAGATSSGRRPRITLRGSCVMGRTLFLDLRGGTPNGFAFLAWGGAADIDLAGIGAPGNRAYIAPMDSIFLGGDAHGLVRHRIDVPVSLGLVGAGLSLQFGVFDGAANALGIVTSNAVDLEIYN